MNDQVRATAEGIARKTSRRGFFGRGANLAFGALIGAAAGSVTHVQRADAGVGTVCEYPGQLCHCDKCVRGGAGSNGVCAKPCVLSTIGYASGCWVTEGVTCCDCDCRGIEGVGICGCASDAHSDIAFCPEAAGSGRGG